MNESNISTDFDNVFSKLQIVLLSKDFENLDEILKEIIYYSNELNIQHLNVIDLAIKSYVIEERKKYFKIENHLNSIKFSNSNPNSTNFIVNDVNKASFNNSTKHLIKLALNRETSDSLINKYTFIEDENKKKVLIELSEIYKKSLLKKYDQYIKIFEEFADMKLKNGNNIKNKFDSEYNLFFTKYIADFKRYTYELSSTEENKESANLSYIKAYQYASEISQKNNILNLKFILNYTVFLHDVLGENEKAINIIKSILEETLKDEEINMDTIYDKDLIIIWQLMKDNLSLWMHKGTSDFSNWLNNS